MKVKSNGSGLIYPFLLFILLISLTFPLAIFSGENELDTNLINSIWDEVADRLSRREYSAALALCDTLPPEYARSTQVRIMRASIYNAAGRPVEARRIAESIISTERNNTEALMILADAALLENRDRDRRQFLDRVISIDPNHARALNDLANINLRNQNLRNAATYFDRALAAEPNNGEALVGRASVHRYNREPRNAERLLNQAISLYPNWARPFAERGRLYKGAGLYADAIEDFSEALRLDPENYWVLVDYGQTLMEVNQRQEALDLFNRAIKADSNIFMAYVYSAALKDEFGDYAGAEQDYLQLTRLRPDYYFGFEALGVIRMRNKQWALARDAFLEAYKQAPREYSYALLAAINWMRAGRQTDPRQFLAQVLRATPRDTVEHAMLRLFHDLNGDENVAILVENERNILKKSQMLFYLASYYDIRGSRTLSDRFYLLSQELDAVGSLEWQLNEIVLKERGIGLRIE
ncbi:MAG: tetratricopeptide repeat protein [Treponema sp.]|nr:tetratricopeptide repeat protein [Treponema sp.]